jgi:uncharacterized protein YjbI with pentapeptide repeats
VIFFVFVIFPFFQLFVMSLSAVWKQESFEAFYNEKVDCFFPDTSALDGRALLDIAAEDADILYWEFRGCSMEDMLFSESRMQECRFTQCRLSEVVFAMCDLTGCVFDGCVFLNCEFEKCVLNDGVFRGAKFRDCVFSNCTRMNDTLFFDSTFTNTVFRSSCLSACIVEKTDFNKAHLCKRTRLSLSAID